MALTEKLPSYALDVLESRSLPELHETLEHATAEMGFRYFAVAMDIGLPNNAVRHSRLHNYPKDWERMYDLQGFGFADPVQRASRIMARGFWWSELPSIVEFTDLDRHIIATARSFGVSDGCTIPAAVARNAYGSVSFAIDRSQRLPEHFLLPQLVGVSAFQIFHGVEASGRNAAAPPLTPRQLEAICWVGRGMTDQQIAREMRIGVHGVVQHLRHARIRWGAPSRATLPLLAVRNGALSLGDFELDSVLAG